MRFALIVRIATLSLALFALLTPGCGKVRDAAARAKRSNDLKQIGLMYHNYIDTNAGKAPASADDLMKMTAGDPQASQVVQAVKSGQYVLLWGSTIKEMSKSPGGIASMVLGYEKDVPTAGGVVLMADASTRNMTAAEFQAAPKAPGK
jgi:hypothetical protein